jgi:hypothetical protein
MLNLLRAASISLPPLVTCFPQQGLPATNSLITSRAHTRTSKSGENQSSSSQTNQVFGPFRLRSDGSYQTLATPAPGARTRTSFFIVPFSTLHPLLAAMCHVAFAPRLSRDATFNALLLNRQETYVNLYVAE